MNAKATHLPTTPSPRRHRTARLFHRYDALPNSERASTMRDLALRPIEPVYTMHR